MQGRADEGRKLLEQAVARDPDNAEALFQLGILEDRAKHSDQAASTFQRVVALRPFDPRAWDYLGLNLEPLGRVAEAGRAYKQGLAVNEKPLFDWFLDYNYGRLLLKLNRLPESKAHLDRAVELLPRLRASHYDRAKLHLRMGELEAAKREAELALSLQDSAGLILDLQVYNLLASVYSRLGDEQNAKKYADLSQSARIPVRSETGR